MSSNALCKACVLLEGLNRGLPKLGITGNADKMRREQGSSEVKKGKGVEVQHFSDLVNGLKIMGV